MTLINWSAHRSDWLRDTLRRIARGATGAVLDGYLGVSATAVHRQACAERESKPRHPRSSRSTSAVASGDQLSHSGSFVSGSSIIRAAVAPTVVVAPRSAPAASNSFTVSTQRLVAASISGV
jgi:hypothetical protein